MINSPSCIKPLVDGSDVNTGAIKIGPIDELTLTASPAPALFTTLVAVSTAKMCRLRYSAFRGRDEVEIGTPPALLSWLQVLGMEAVADGWATEQEYQL